MKARVADDTRLTSEIVSGSEKSNPDVDVLMTNASN